MRKWITGGVWTAGLLLLAGCGGSGSDPQPDAAGPPAAKSGNAAAAEVAAEARGKVRCPAKVAARPAGTPVDDVVGVRPGLTHDEAVNVVLCSHELLVVADASSSRNFRIQTHGQPLRQGFTASFAKDRVQRTSQQIMQDLQDSAMARSSNRRVQDVAPGEAKWYVATMGMPGEERVISAAREEWFAEGAWPTVQSVEQALVGKYGPPTQRNELRNAGAELRWAHDLRQRPILESSPLFNQCRAQADPDAGNSFSPDCGLVVTARIQARRDNPALAEALQVSVIDQAGGYAAITATEQGLQQQENQRRAREVEDAARNAGGPTL